ncbi:MAG TPA: prolipoprotein diacylglyceryl transferase family protein [Streptosporangiaceae bacterium]|nr:prolipoprotein diacylglyceryl transferase family protein [Streptosporangiaceae bacterium]
MPVASLPGPFSGVWRLGPVALHGYAVCVVLGVLLVLWLTERRYRAVGGRPWLIVDIATVAVPAGLVGARIYRVAVDYQRYFGHGHDWVGIARIWDGGLSLPGAAAGAFAAAYLWCRARGLAIGPVLVAAAPAVAIGAAISILGNWFDQSLYGPPSTLPWAVQISPANRLAGYQDFGTFQPLFLYEAIWNAAGGVALIYLIRRLNATGDRAFAACVGCYAIGLLGVESFVPAGPQHQSGMLIKQLAALAVLAAACGYLYATRSKLGPEPLAASPGRGWSVSPGVIPAGTDSALSPNASRVASAAPRPPSAPGIASDDEGVPECASGYADAAAPTIAPEDEGTPEIIAAPEDASAAGN